MTMFIEHFEILTDIFLVVLCTSVYEKVGDKRFTISWKELRGVYQERVTEIVLKF